MRLDPVVSMGWSGVKQTLLSATWKWEPADEADGDCRRLADFANDVWGLDGRPGMMLAPWEQQLTYLLEYAPLGYRYAEEMYAYKHGLWILSRYEDRDPQAHLRWGSDPERIGPVEQSPVDGRTPSAIPGDKLLLLTRNRVGTDWEGEGLFRAARFDYEAKKLLKKIRVVGHERYAKPPMLIDVLRQAAQDAGFGHLIESVDGDAVSEGPWIRNAKTAARGLRSQQESVLIQNEFVRFGQLDTGGYNPTSLRDDIESHNLEILAAFGLGFLRMGLAGNSGNRSLGEVHRDFFLRQAANLLDEVAGAVSGPAREGGGTIGRLAEWNFGVRDARMLPRLRHYGLTVDPLLEMLEPLERLARVGGFTFTDEVEDQIRSRARLGELADADRRTPLERQAQATANGGAVAMFDALSKRGR